MNPFATDYANRYDVIKLAAQVARLSGNRLWVVKYPGEFTFGVTAHIGRAIAAGAQVVWDSSELG